MNTILEKIIEAKRSRIAAVKRSGPLEAVRPPVRPGRFREALVNSAGPTIIAEFKRASPSKGVINQAACPADTARAYQSGGAAAISVLTEEDFFGGSLDDLRQIRDAVSLPVLRKDFVIDEFQVRETAAVGADAVLLIVAALDINELRDLYGLAAELGLDVVVEVHDENEMEVALDIDAGIVGVNNRNLKTFEVTLDVSRRLARLAPTGAVLVSESGIRTVGDVLDLHERGYRAFLVGETLMRNADPSAGLRDLLATAGSDLAVSSPEKVAG